MTTTTCAWTPIDPTRTHIGRSLGGPPTILAGRLFAPPGRLWPRLRLGVYPGPDGPEVRSEVKKLDHPEAGWDAAVVPEELAEEVGRILAEAERATRARRRPAGV